MSNALEEQVLRSTKKRHQLGATGTIFRSYCNAIYALVMHDIKSRFFGNGLGQVLMIIWPFVHIVLLLAIYTVSGRIAPHNSVLRYWSNAVYRLVLYV